MKKHKDTFKRYTDQIRKCVKGAMINREKS